MMACPAVAYSLAAGLVTVALFGSTGVAGAAKAFVLVYGVCAKGFGAQVTQRNRLDATNGTADRARNRLCVGSGKWPSSSRLRKSSLLRGRANVAMIVAATRPLRERLVAEGVRTFRCSRPVPPQSGPMS